MKSAGYSPLTPLFRVCDEVRVRFADNKALLPNSETHPLDAGHFAWEQASEDYGRLIVDWVTGGCVQHVGGAATA
jgi:hypothetical protein